MKQMVKKIPHATLLFASFMFLQLIILRMGNQAGRGFLAEKQQERVYIFLQIFVICGIALHALLCVLLKSSRALQVIRITTLGICVPCTAFMLFAPIDSVLYLTIAFVAVFCVGVTAGAVYLHMSQYCRKENHIGVCMGAGYSVAMLLQFFLQLQWTIKPVLLILTFAAATVLYVLLRKSPRVEVAEKKEKRVSVKYLISVCVIAAAMLTFTSFYNGYIHHNQIATAYTTYNVYTLPRLLMIPAMLFFGLLGDFRNGRFLPLGTLCVSIIAFLNTVFIGKAEIYWLNMCFYYVALSAAVAYYNLTFWRLAQSTRLPAVWSVAGRVIDSVVVIPFCLLPIADAPAGIMLSLNIVALAAMIVLTAFNGDFNFSQPLQKTTSSPDEALTAVSVRFGLTPAESRVLRELILTDDKQNAIAINLKISVSTLRHHITSIYKKTGTQTRTALCKLVNVQVE